MTGNWYCVPSSCAEVVYQEYLPPVVRWRYPGENWQEIEADDYSLAQIQQPCPGQPHELNYGRQNVLNPRGSCTRTDITVFAPRRSWTGNTNAPFSNLRISVPEKNIEQIYSDPLTAPEINLIYCGDFTPRTYVYVTDSLGIERQIVSTAGYGFVFFNFRVVPNSSQNCPPSNCTFTVTKNGATVHQETRSICPEVEKLPCRLSEEIKRIEIEKLPYLERVEVVDYAYQVYLGLLTPNEYGLILQKTPIPNECLNIYQNNITATIPFDNFPNFANAPTSAYKLITQICSAPGCPPPQYQVLCDSCGCESCPPGTRAVTCGDSVCCYGSDGVSQKEIPSSDYCGGGDCD